MTWFGKGHPKVARLGLSGLWRDRLAEASDRWRCWARKVEMLRARVWWAHLWGFSGGVVVVDGGGVWAFVALGRRPMGATCSWL